MITNKTDIYTNYKTPFGPCLEPKNFKEISQDKQTQRNRKFIGSKRDQEGQLASGFLIVREVGSLDEFQAVGNGLCLEGVLPLCWPWSRTPVAVAEHLVRPRCCRRPPPWAAIELLQAPDNEAGEAEQPHAKPEQRSKPDVTHPVASTARLTIHRRHRKGENLQPQLA
ncbi:unnamed protein product [Urochloa humidicola]